METLAPEGFLALCREDNERDLRRVAVALRLIELRDSVRRPITTQELLYADEALVPDQPQYVQVRAKLRSNSYASLGAEHEFSLPRRTLDRDLGPRLPLLGVVPLKP